MLSTELPVCAIETEVQPVPGSNMIANVTMMKACLGRSQTGPLQHETVRCLKTALPQGGSAISRLDKRDGRSNPQSAADDLPAMMEDPNRFDGFPTDELVAEIKKGQATFARYSVVNTSLPLAPGRLLKYRILA
ncbi:hypothetical protein [Xanthomonas graminis]|uniref:hypothetical protein n=1 Tax=Xanthomonas graminis TaxID=3390026 RepID=UPI001E652B84|nr:hypothetical protein [Xanthomonas translucens]